MKGKKKLAALSVVLAVVAGLASDKRRWPKKPSRRFSVRNTTWQRVLHDPAFADGWSPLHFRCNRATFLAIVSRIEQRWPSVRPAPRHNAHFPIRDRVAVAFYYVTHGGSAYDAGQIVGAGKTQALLYICQVIQVVTSFSSETIRLPSTEKELAEVMQGFEEMLGFPGVVGAIDGTLITIKRFEDFEGFYCRKGFPAFNLMAVVDNELRFIAFSIRNGAQNDQSVLNRSLFGQQLTTNLPDSAHYLGDAGYKLMKQMMTPYPITYGMAMKNSHYNYVHTHTRIVVERAFGRLKGMFRIYKQPLLQHTPECMARIIVATLVMHNWLIEFKDSKECEIEEWMLLRLDDERSEIDDVRGDAKRNKIRDKRYAEYIANN